MVHKKYSYKNGKVYGPYFYENNRVDGKVVTTYVGKADSATKPAIKYVLIALGIAVVLGFLFFATKGSPTGRAVLDVSSSYSYGEPLSGVLRLALKAGELIPKDTQVVATLGSGSVSLPLSSLISAQQVSGNFFAENSSISGYGAGFGVPGLSGEPSEILFKISISNKENVQNTSSGTGGSSGSSGNTSENISNITNSNSNNQSVQANINQSSQISNETASVSTSNNSSSSSSSNSSNSSTSQLSQSSATQNTPQTTNSSEASSSSSADSSSADSPSSSSQSTGASDSSTSPTSPALDDSSAASSSAPASGTGQSSQSDSQQSGSASGADSTSALTGNAILESPLIIEGNVTTKNNFSYSFDSGQTAEIVPGSVHLSNGTVLPDSFVSIDNAENSTTVYTSYSGQGQGFGQNFIGVGTTTLSINLSAFGLNVTSDSLNLTLFYNDTVITSSQVKLSVAGQIPPANSTLLTNQTNLTVIGNETNQTITANETNFTSNFSQIKNIPSLRIYPNDSIVVNLSDYFAGAENYTINISAINSFINEGMLNLTPPLGFIGARQGVLTAYSGNYSLESNRFNVIVSASALSITTLRSKIVVGEPVQWTKNISLDSSENITIQIPGSAQNITVTKKDNSTDRQTSASANIQRLTGNAINIEGLQTGKTGLAAWLSSLFSRFTGFAVADNATNASPENTSQPINITLADNATNYLVQYYTPAPTLMPVNNGNVSNMFVVSGPDGLNYTDVVASVNLESSIPSSAIGDYKLYWYNYNFEKNSDIKSVSAVDNVTVVDQIVQQSVNDTLPNETGNSANVLNGSNSSSENISSQSSQITGSVISGSSDSGLPESLANSTFNGPAADGTPQGVEGIDYKLEEIPFDAYDLNGDGQINYIEWVVPHLSNQTFALSFAGGANASVKNISFIGNYSYLSINPNAPYDKLVGYWSFDVANSSAAYDLTGHGGNEAFNSNTKTVPSLYGNALDLNGSTSIQVTPVVSSISNFQNFTVSLWFRRHNVTDNVPGVIRGFGGTGYGESWRLAGNAPGNINVGLTISNSSVLTGSDLVLAGTIDKWYYLAFTYDNSTGNVTGYSAGLPVFTTTLAKGIYYPSPGSTNIVLGSCDGCGNLNGSIDEVMLFNGSLTSQQILDIYNNQSARFVSQGTIDAPEFNISKQNDLSINVTLDNFIINQASNITERIGRWDISQGYNNTDPNLALYLHADGNAVDSSLQSKNGTLMNGATANSPGVYNSSLLLNGTDYVNTSIVRANASGNFSAFAWINPKSNSGLSSILSEGCGGFVLGLNGTQLQFGLNCSGLPGGTPTLSTANFTNIAALGVYNVTSSGTVLIKAWGAGGSSNSGAGGGGGFEQANFSVQAGDGFLTRPGGVGGIPTYAELIRSGSAIGWIVSGSGGYGDSGNGNNGGAGGGFEGDSGATESAGCCGLGGGGGTQSGGGAGGSTGGATGTGPLSSLIHYNGGSGDSGGGYGGAGWYGGGGGGGNDVSGEGGGGGGSGHVEGGNATINTTGSGTSPGNSGDADYSSGHGSADQNGYITLKIYSAGTSGNSSFGGGTGAALNPVRAGFIPTNTWSYVGIVYNGTNATLYVNGAAVATTTGNFTSAGQSLFVGALDGSQMYFNGTVDEVSVFNRSLAPDEVSSMYVKGRANWDYTPYKNITLTNSTHAVTVFEIKNTTTNILPSFLLSSNYQFYTPFLASSVSAPVNFTFSINDLVPPVVNFTFPTPANNTIASGSAVNTALVNISSTDAETHHTFSSIDEDLALWLRMDDINGSGQYIDLSSYNSTINTIGGVPADNSGHVGKAARFFGNGSYLRVQDNPGLQRPISSGGHNSSVYSGVTISAWVKYNGTQVNFNNIISKDWRSDGTFVDPYAVYQLLGTDGSALNDPYFCVAITNYGHACVTPSTSLSNNTWYNIVGVYNGTNEALFINGARVALSSALNGAIYQYDSTYTINPHDLAIGSQSAYYPGGYFNGSIDDVMVFARGLTEAEVFSLYNATSNQYQANRTLATAKHTLTGYSIDDANNMANTETRTFYTDVINQNLTFASANPANGSIVGGNSFVTAANINEDNLKSVIYNFNGSNRTIYDGNVTLFLNFDNRSALGENGNTLTDISNYNYPVYFFEEASNSYSGFEMLNNSGRYGSAYYTNNSCNGVAISNTGYRTLPRNGSFTISSWIDPFKLPSPGEVGSLITQDLPNRGDYTVKGYRYGIDGNGGVGFSFWSTQDGGTLGLGYYPGAGVIKNNTWYHVVISYNPDPAVNSSMYVNGQLVSSGGGFVYGSESDIGIGGEISGYGCMNGLYDDVIILNRSVSSAEAQQLYSSSLTKLNSTVWSLSTNQTNITNGTYTYQVHGIDSNGFTNSTEARTINYYITAPSIYYTNSTPDNASNINNILNVSVSSSDVFPHYVLTDFDRSLLLWLRMDDFDSQGNLLDLSSYRVGASTKGTVPPVQNSSGKFGKSFSFDGNGGYIQSGGSSNLSGNRTIVAWVYPNVNTGYGLPIAVGGTSGNGDLFGIAGTSGTCNVGQNNLYLDHYFTTCYNSTLAVTPNAWNLVAISYNSASSNVTFYINGNNSTSLAGSFFTYTLNSYTIGGNTIGGTTTKTGFNGSIDDVMIFNRTLSGAEIASLYNATASQYINNFTPLGQGYHTIQSYAEDSLGNVNSTDYRVLFADSLTPSINFTNPTPINNSFQGLANSVYVNVTSNDTNQNYVLTDFDRSLLLWLRMDDVNGTGGVLDKSSWGNNATVNGGASQNSSGKFGNSYTFYGNTGYLKTSSSVTPSVTNITLSLWVYWRGTSQNAVIFANGNSGSDGYELYVGGSCANGNQAILLLGGVNCNALSSSPVIPNRVWTNLVLTRNATNSWQLYVNGALNTTGSGNPNVPSTGATIGGNSFGAEIFNGSIDEVAFFNRSLSAAEIASLYNASAANYQNNFTQLRAGTHSITSYVVDVSGNRNQTETRFVTTDLPPSVSSVVLNSTFGNNKTVENLTAYFSQSDTDSTFVTNITDWRVNGSSIAVLNMPFNLNTTNTSSRYVRDYSLYANNGTISGGVVWNASGKVGGAYSFDGTSGYISAGNLGNFYSKGTISFWMNPSVVENYRNPFTTSYSGGNAGIRFEEASSGSFTAVIGNDGGSYTGHNYLTSGLSPNTWYHVVLTWDNTSNIATGYLNGTLVFNDSQTLWATTLPNVTVGEGFSTARYWKGLVDEVEIWNRSLSGDEIQQIYLAGAAGKSVQTMVSRELKAGQNWTVAVTPNDYWQDGPTVVSNSLLVSAGSVTNCTNGCLIVTNKSGSNKTLFDKQGNLDVAGIINQNSIGSPDGNDLLIKNGAGTVVAWVDDVTGNINLASSLFSNQGGACTPPSNSFVIKNSTGSCVSYINNTGSLWLSGSYNQLAII